MVELELDGYDTLTIWNETKNFPHSVKRFEKFGEAFGKRPALFFMFERPFYEDYVAKNKNVLFHAGVDGFGGNNKHGYIIVPPEGYVDDNSKRLHLDYKDVSTSASRISLHELAHGFGIHHCYSDYIHKPDADISGIVLFEKFFREKLVDDTELVKFFQRTLPQAIRRSCVMDEYEIFQEFSENILKLISGNTRLYLQAFNNQTLCSKCKDEFEKRLKILS